MDPVWVNALLDIWLKPVFNRSYSLCIMDVAR